MSFAFIIRHIHHFVNSLECVSLVIMQNDQIPLSFRKSFKSIRKIFKQLIVNKRIIGQRIRRNLIRKFDMYFYRSKVINNRVSCNRVDPCRQRSF